MRYRKVVSKIANWEHPFKVFKKVFSVRTMRGKVVAAIAATSFEMPAGPGR
jgi:hypothetical protein